ncbi:MAG: YbhB/YbcL family Raf kinase inhibitor-like protein [Pseudomonadota bacterium]
MGIAHEVSVAAGHVLQGVRAGASKLAAQHLAEGMVPTVEVRSIAFEADASLPISCTADGVGAAPPLHWTNVPEYTRSLVVICEDPDAPALEPFLHWLVYGIPADIDGVDAQSQHDWPSGQNGRGEVGFTPAAPPSGHGVHHYHFQVFALDVALDMKAGSERRDVLELMTGHVLAWGELVGTYQRE